MPNQGGATKSERRYDYDWLRIICLFFVFIGHIALLFHPDLTFIVNNPERSFAVNIYCFWPEMWFLNLFFLVAGAASWYSLRSRSSRQFILARIKRILIPMYTLGLFIILPTMYYFWLARNTDYNKTYLETLPVYFSKLFDLYPEPSSLLPLPYENYFWFLKFLFLISLFTLPLVQFLRSEKGLRFIKTLAGWCERRGGIFIFLIPIILVRIILYSKFGNWNSWGPFVSYALFYMIGFIFPADKRFSEGMHRNCWAGLVLGIGGYTLSIFWIYGGNYDFYWEPFSLKFILFQIIYSMGRWGWIIFIMTMVAKYMNRNSKTLAYLNEAVLPFYILHFPIVLLAAALVVTWDLRILPKFIIIVASSFTITMVLYHFLIRPISVLRFLFGMGPKRKPIKVSAGRRVPQPD